MTFDELEEKEYDDPEIFLQALSSLAISDYANSALYFRGQRDPSWKLIPSLWRKDHKRYVELLEKDYSSELAKIKKNINAGIKCYQEADYTVAFNLEEKRVYDWTMWISYEHHLLNKFYNNANKAGLKSIQGVNDSLCPYDPGKSLGIFNEYWQYLKNPNKKISFDPIPRNIEASLPQHYGLSTRLLDWSRSPFIAAFFAAKGNSICTEDTPIAVYILKKIPVNNDGPVKLIDQHSHYENPFLHAQQGVFTRIHGDIHFLENGQWPSLEDLQENYRDEFQLKKITLKKECVNNLLKMLGRLNISTSTMMPHYSSIVKQIKEENLI